MTYIHTREKQTMRGGRHTADYAKHLMKIWSTSSQFVVLTVLRNRILEDMEQIVTKSNRGVNFKEGSPKHLTQFILDCTSLNLPFRYKFDDENNVQVFNLSRYLCFHIKKKRAQKLKIINA